MAAQEGVQLAEVSRALGNDVLLAVSCGEAGIWLVTANTRDFARIRRYATFHYTPPWPKPAR
jgi:predicted nucleic acid-binding protein